MAKKTNVELFKEVLSQLNGATKTEFQAYVDGYVSKAEKTAANRAKKNQENNQVLIDALKKVLNATPKTRDAILEEIKASGLTKVGDKEITAQKITSVLTAMNTKSVEIKDGKKKKVGYIA